MNQSLRNEEVQQKYIFIGNVFSVEKVLLEVLTADLVKTSNSKMFQFFDRLKKFYSMISGKKNNLKK